MISCLSLHWIHRGGGILTSFSSPHMLFPQCLCLQHTPLVKWDYQPPLPFSCIWWGLNPDFINEWQTSCPFTYGWNEGALHMLSVQLMRGTHVGCHVHIHIHVLSRSYHQKWSKFAGSPAPMTSGTKAHDTFQWTTATSLCVTGWCPFIKPSEWCAHNV